MPRPPRALRAVSVERRALDVAVAREGDDHHLLVDQLLDVEAALDLLGGDLGAARVAVALLEVVEVLADDRDDAPCLREDVLEVGDLGDQRAVLVLELLALEAGQAAQAHVDDGLRLALREREGGLQPGLGLVRARAAADDPDDLVDVVDGDAQALDDVQPLLGLAQQEQRAPADDLLAVREVGVEQAAQAQRARLAAVDHQVDDRLRGLQRRVLVELVDDDLRVLALLELDDQPDALPVGLVAHVGDAGDPAVLHDLDDLLDDARLADLVGDLRDDELLLRAHVLDLDAAAQAHEPAARRVGLQDAAPAHDDAAGREVGAADDLAELAQRDVGRVEHGAQRGDDLAQVVRREARGHAHRDAVRAVAEQVREAPGQHDGLGQRLVVVRDAVDRLAVEVRHQLDGGAVHARLRVAHGCRRIAVDRAEVALAVDQRVARRERLGEPHERRIDDRFAVRVVVARGVAGDLRALAVLGARRQVQVVHRDQDPPLGGLEAVADVGQGPGVDHRERVRQVRLAHLALDQPRYGALRRSLLRELVGVAHRSCVPGKRP